MKGIVKQASVNGKLGILRIFEESGNSWEAGLTARDIGVDRLAVGQEYDITFSPSLTLQPKKG